MSETTLYGVMVLILVALMFLVPALWIGDLRRRIRALEYDVLDAGHQAQVAIQEAQQQVQEAEQRAAAWKQELERTLAAFTEVQRQAVYDHRFKARPMEHPPVGIQPTLDRLNRLIPIADDPYGFAIGWEEKNGQPGLAALSLWNDSTAKAGQILITGEIDSGKSSLAFLILSTLCLRTTTGQLRVFIIDPKRVDGAYWKGKAHNWRDPVLGAKDAAGIKAGMEALRAERELREQLIERYKVDKWEALPVAVRPPLLVVYVAELEVLELGTDNLEGWLKAELTSARASGIRYILDTQTVSNKVTTWRGQLPTKIAGCQSSQDAVKPNVGLSLQEIEELGGIPPHKLPGPGYFVVRNKREVLTVRTPRITSDERWRVLEALPNAPEALQPASTRSEGIEALQPASETAKKPAESPPARSTEAPEAAKPAPPAVVVTTQEKADILAAAEKFPSRRQVCSEVFNTTGGEAYKKVQLVLDEAEKLLPPKRTTFSDPKLVESA